jgi:hypothetical protein
MKSLLAIFLALTLGAAILQAAAFEKSVAYKSTKITITADKPLVVGNNVLHFNVTQKGAAPAGAEVTVKVFMPAMPGMPYMQSEVEAKDLGNGKYEAVINFAMGGTWQVHIFIVPHEGKKSRVKTSVNI